MIIVLGNMRLQAGAVDKLAPAMQTLLQKARKDDGCISYHFARDIEDQNQIRFIECWRDMKALEAHNAQPHMADFLSVAKPHLAGAPEIIVHEAREGRAI